MNFVPTRPVEEIAREYIQGFWDLYEPKSFLDRTYHHYRILGEAPCHKQRRKKKKKKSVKKQPTWMVVKALLIICWRQGVVRETRWKFWPYLFSMWRHNPRGVGSYLAVCAQIEHFLEYRQVVKNQIEAQLAEFLANEERLKAELMEKETMEVIVNR